MDVTFGGSLLSELYGTSYENVRRGLDLWISEKKLEFCSIPNFIQI